MADISHRRAHLKWLMELTAIPTAAGRESRVMAWVEDWVAARKQLRLTRDRAGNLIIAPRARPRGGHKPIFITAHLDHPAFVVIGVRDSRTIELEFRGGVHDPYFHRAKFEVIDTRDKVHHARITKLDSKAQPFKRVTARLAKPATSIAPGDVGRWHFAGRLPRISRGQLHTRACDDLAGVAAALAALDVLHRHKATNHVGVLLTRAEEIGFIGAIAACKLGTVAKSARLICLENSRSFAESPIGAGPIVRVGDRISVFSPALTNRISAIMTGHAKTNPKFAWQRKLMAGGACEATTFSTYGYESTCLCLALGNYHNMADIDGVLAGGGKRPARMAPEIISVSDYHGLIDMLVICCTQLDSADVPDMRDRMEQLIARHKSIVGL